jgi:hypothetical protein
MTTLARNNYLQMTAVTENNTNYPFELQEIRELCLNEIESVSGGLNWDQAISRGFGIGGALGGMYGAAAYGSVAGFTTYGALGAVLGGSFGAGWYVGSRIYNVMND